MRVVLVAFGCACLMLSAAVQAQVLTRGAYLGGGLGQAKMTDWCDTTGAPSNLRLRSCEDTDTGFKLFGGYQFLRYLAAEGSYINWGKVEGSFFPPGPNSVTAKHQSFGAAALGTLPLGDWFSLFGKLGLLYTEQKVDTLSETGSETEVHYGLGARLHFVRNGALRVEWEATSEVKLQMISASLEFRF
jgi:OmpA-OmpF porin, OOP family